MAKKLREKASLLLGKKKWYAPAMEHIKTTRSLRVLPHVECVDDVSTLEMYRNSFSLSHLMNINFQSQWKHIEFVVSINVRTLHRLRIIEIYIHRAQH